MPLHQGLLLPSPTDRHYMKGSATIPSERHEACEKSVAIRSLPFRAPSSGWGGTPLDLLGPQNSESCDKFCEARQSMTRRIWYRPTWINDLTAPVIGERSPFCEKSGASEPLDSPAPGEAGRGACPLPVSFLSWRSSAEHVFPVDDGRLLLIERAGQGRAIRSALFRTHPPALRT